MPNHLLRWINRTAKGSGSGAYGADSCARRAESFRSFEEEPTLHLSYYMYYTCASVPGDIVQQALCARSHVTVYLILTGGTINSRLKKRPPGISPVCACATRSNFRQQAKLAQPLCTAVYRPHLHLLGGAPARRTGGSACPRTALDSWRGPAIQSRPTGARTTSGIRSRAGAGRRRPLGIGALMVTRRGLCPEHAVQDEGV